MVWKSGKKASHQNSKPEIKYEKMHFVGVVVLGGISSLRSNDAGMPARCTAV